MIDVELKNRAFEYLLDSGGLAASTASKKLGISIDQAIDLLDQISASNFVKSLGPRGHKMFAIEIEKDYKIQAKQWFEAGGFSIKEQNKYQLEKEERELRILQKENLIITSAEAREAIKNYKKTRLIAWISIGIALGSLVIGIIALMRSAKDF